MRLIAALALPLQVCTPRRVDRATLNPEGDEPVDLRVPRQAPVRCTGWSEVGREVAVHLLQCAPVYASRLVAMLLALLL